jgi:hypothetical protein
MYKKKSDTNPANAKPLTCKDIANILIKTYRPSIIDSFSKDLRIACEQEALKIIDKSDNYMHRRQRGRKVLAKLITNRKTTPAKVDFVGGPYNITHHWSKKYNKEIYIWGEQHDETVDCPNLEDKNIINIEKFLQNIFFINPIAFSDFYLEMHSYVVPDGYKEYGESQSRMNILRNLFGNCIGTNRNLYRTCDNSRMHFFDIRQGQVRWGKNSSCLFMNECLSFISYANSKLKEHKDKMYQNHPKLDENSVWDESCYDFTFLKEITIFVERWKSFLDFFTRFYNNDVNTKLNYNKFWYDQIYNFKLLAKEINVMHTDVKPLLNIFIKKELDYLLLREHIQMAEDSETVISIYENIKEYTHSKQFNALKYRDIKELIDSWYNVTVRVLDFNALIADGYLLARIFKTFKVYDRFSLYPRKTDEPAEPHNIVIYAGNAHSQRYRLFLKYLGFNLIESSGGLKDPDQFSNCVDISRINQPFFSKWEDRQDKPLYKKYFGTPDDLYYSFESVFTFDTPDKFILFNQPNVPDDLLSQVSYNDRKYVEPKPGKYTLYTYDPFNRSRP